jgi:hypothetical protein
MLLLVWLDAEAVSAVDAGVPGFSFGSTGLVMTTSRARKIYEPHFERLLFRSDWRWLALALWA